MEATATASLLAQASRESKRTEWVAISPTNELFGVDVLLDVRGEVIGHVVVVRHRGGGLETLARYPAELHPGEDTFGVARADAVLASTLPSSW